ncbi:putative virion structural protein [Erwinia phage vB_EamM_Stratton]|uniref:Putative virion structural protein n=2 Tax=Erskinevirus EaH2 TaxID=2169883 RepID=A0A1B2IHB0_9CAUD|nr:virion structural protein [Erwinia phage phiEaH2]AFQ96669.1 putative virion structural protein [Erwinia phage phiEaH2]ANZ50649.1 putative virion structural protein [Erwinia phage vB_EamM_Stratton]
MLDLQGFIQIPALFDNVDGVTAPVGELSELTKSYAKSKQTFAKSNLQVELVTFTSKRDEATVVVPSEFSDHILTVTQWIYNQAILGNLKNDEIEFQRLLVGQFQNTISGVQSGAMVQTNSNWFPRWVSWKLETTAGKLQDPTDVSNQIIVWFADEDFDQNYTGFEIEVQMPILPVDTFLAVKSVVEKAMESFNLSDHHKKINELMDGFPYTNIQTNYYTWHDQEDYEATLIIPMSVIIYGRAGKNPSRIKQALRDYILANSSFTVPLGVKVFPEIFTTTKFTIVPGWKIRGIPNEEDIAAQYSPILPYDFWVKAISKFGEWEALTVSDKNSGVIPKPTTDVTDLPSIYKSLNGVVISGPENDTRKATLHETIPDYALIATTNPDIARMSKATTEWYELFFKALIAAEEYHPYQTDLDIVKLVDDANPEIYFYVFEYDNVEYRVLARKAVWEDTTP